MESLRPPTIADLLQINQHLIVSCCWHACRRERRIPAAEAVRLLGAATTFEVAERRLKCTACGALGRRREIKCRPCSLDLAAWSARQEAAEAIRKGEEPSERLVDYLAQLQALANGQLGGDGPVRMPVEVRSKVL